MYQERTYRNRITPGPGRSFFQVTVQETDLLIHAPVSLKSLARERILHYRGHIQGYIERHPAFAGSLAPLPLSGPAPSIVRHMAAAGEAAGTGPMAAVAGAVAEYVGQDLLFHTPEVTVENGGDIFLVAPGQVTVALFAGTSPLSMKIGLRLDCHNRHLAVCTSSGTVGHSLSMGKADAVCVVSDDCPLADAAATAIGNRIMSPGDIADGIAFGRSISGLKGIVIIVGDRIGAWGGLELVPVSGKKG